MSKVMVGLICVVLSLGNPHIRAEKFLLTNGGQIEGNLIGENSDPRNRYYLVKTTTGGVFKLYQAQVERVVRKSPAQIQYENDIRPKIDDTVDSHWNAAQWCLENGLQRQREFHLQQIIRLNPDHEEARYGLGYSRVKGKWVQSDEWNRAQGLVLDGRSWRHRQELELEAAAERRELAEKKWLRDLKMWRDWIGKRRHADAIANIRAIDDPLAATALGEMLESEPEINFRLLYVEVLGKLPGAAANAPLIKAAIDDGSDAVRKACLEQLQEDGTRQAVASFVKTLDPKGQPDNVRINRAGIALSWMKDESAIPDLIDALVTQHIVKPGNGPSGGMTLSPTFGSGGTGFNFGGGRSKATLQTVPNEGVRAALRSLTGEDFGFDQERWRQWYIDDNTPGGIDLRRG